MDRTRGAGGFELAASVVLWRGDEILVMKRAAGFSAGGWFVPGGHLEGDERPAEACARELFEEAGIRIDAADLRIVDVLTHNTGGANSAHIIIYAAECPVGVEPAINEEHHTARWMTPDAYIARFLDPSMLRGRGVGEGGISLAQEVTRVVRSAQKLRGEKA
jgi:8-oxo-dGTP pyrophosphatase MutT (NUDIX family)